MLPTTLPKDSGKRMGPSFNDDTLYGSRLTAICQDNLSKSVPECLHSGFYWS